MKALAILASFAFVVMGCSSSSPAAQAPSPSPPSNPSALASPTPPASSPSPSPSPAPATPPVVACSGKPLGGPMVLIGRRPAPLHLYEVSDPLHPRLLCRITGTTAHLFTGDTITYLRTAGSGTEVVLRTLGSGNESVVTSVPKAGLEGSYYGPTAWTADGSLTAVTIPPADTSNQPKSEVWLFSQRYAGLLYSYPYPLTDCICRFGIPQPTLAFSPDGEYLVAGWPVGRGASPFVVFRLSDRVQVKAFDFNTSLVIWNRTGHRLFLSGQNGSQSWTPESGTATLPGAMPWQFLAGLSPSGSQVAYTSYKDPQNGQPGTLRVFSYEVTSDSTRMLIDQSRSQVVFVKSGWVWYLDEVACDPTGATPGCGPWGSKPGKVLAMNLTSGVESEVVFAPGETIQMDTGTYVFSPGEFWPNS